MGGHNIKEIKHQDKTVWIENHKCLLLYKTRDDVMGTSLYYDGFEIKTGTLYDVERDEKMKKIKGWFASKRMKVRVEILFNSDTIYQEELYGRYVADGVNAYEFSFDFNTSLLRDNGYVNEFVMQLD